MGVVTSAKDLYNKYFGKTEKAIINDHYLIGTPAKNNITESNILIENIYDSIAKELSLVSFRHVHKKKVRREVEQEDTEDTGDETKPKKKYETKYEIEEKPNNDMYLWNVAPNQLQTASEMLHTFFYFVVKYGNGIILPTYDSRGNLTSLEVIDIEAYNFGKGYDKRNGIMYLLLQRKDYGVNGMGSMVGTSGSFSVNDVQEVTALRYDTLIHQRLKPNKVFNNDYYGGTDFDKLTTIFDSNLTAQLEELSQNNQIRGILYLKGMLGKQDSKIVKKNTFVRDMLRSRDKIAVLDDGEDFKPMKEAFKTISTADIDGIVKYLYRMFGINPSIIEGTFTDEQYNAFYNKTLEPMLIRLTQEINRKLISREAFEKGERIVMVKRALVGGSLADKTAYFDKMIYHGMMTRNEAREELGYMPSPDGDELLTNANTVPLRQNSYIRRTSSTSSGTGRPVGRPRLDGSPAGEDSS